MPQRSRSNGRSAYRRQQAEDIEVKNGFRLERRIVAHRHRAIRFARANRRCRFGHGQDPADALVGDAGVRAFEIVADADVAKHVVRQIAQQPHRVHRLD